MAIKNIEHFNYNGINSADMGIYNVNVGSGMLNEPFNSGRQIREEKVNGRSKPYFKGVEYEPLEFTLAFAFKDTWDKEKIREVARWLCQDYYKPLYFNNNIDRVFFAMIVDEPNLVHNALDQGYIELTFRCDSPFSYSKEYLSPTYEFTSNPLQFLEDTQTDFSSGTLTNVTATATGDLELALETATAYYTSGSRVSSEIDLTRPYSYVYVDSTISWNSTTPTGTSIKIEISLDGGTTWKEAVNGNSIPDMYMGKDLRYDKLLIRETLETTDTTATPQLHSLSIQIDIGIGFENDGDVEVSPELWIQKIGLGDISLINHSMGKQVFKFTGLADAETVYIDNENEDIVTDVSNTYRYSNFNNNYLNLVRGMNVLEVVGNARFKFRYRLRTIQG